MRNGMKFITSEGQQKTQEELNAAFKIVAQEERELAKAIRKEDNYASHVTKEAKDLNLKEDLKKADEIESGNHELHFWLWQKVNKVFTGENVALLGK